MTEAISPLKRIQNAFIASLWATILSIAIGYSFKIWLAQIVDKDSLAIYNTVIDVISLSLILMTGFRSSMVVSYSQTKNDKDIINIFRYALITMVLFTWGVVLPYIKHKLAIDVAYIQLVGIIVSMGLKVYFTNLIAMYRLYDISNRVIWIEPLSQVIFFVICFYLFKFSALDALFYSMILSSLLIAHFMYILRRKDIDTKPLAKVELDQHIKGYIKKSITSSLEAGASILMIYMMVLLTIRYFSLSELGDFQVVVRPMITYMTLLFVFPIYRFVLPELAVCVRNKDIQQIKAIKHWLYKIAIIISIIFLCVNWFGGHFIVSTLYPADYLGAVPVLSHFALFFILMMLNAYQLSLLKAYGKFTTSLVIRCLGIITLLISFHIYRDFTHNIIAVIMALGSGYVAMFIAAAIAERKIDKNNALALMDDH
ncbi:membrane protein [Shewanella marina]|uniref:membrane protein n=1 Tax=Shewanella marina TaxID=487319 RepID=UPI00046F5998|nr:membrane protein [Shewanella marina]